MMQGTVTRGQRVLIFGLHLVAVAILALQAYVRRFPPTSTAIPEAHSPEALWWGLWPITYLPKWAFTAGVAAVLLIIFFAWWRILSSGPTEHQAGNGQKRIHIWYMLVAVSALLALAFFAFPIVHTRWGDAYILANTIGWPDPALRLSRSWQAPLDVYVHSSAWLALRPHFMWEDAKPVYRLLSPIAGILYLAALLGLARDDQFAPAWLSYGLLVSLGLIQLFFGYIENYSFAAAFVLLYMWIGLEVVRGKRPLWAAALALAFAIGLHPSTLVLGPSLLYLAWLDLHVGHHSGNYRAMRDVLRTATELAAPMAAILGVTWIIMESGGHGVSTLLTTDRPGGGDASWLVPLREVTTEWERYTLFSWAHVRDFVNEQLLVAPVVLPSLLIVAIGRLSGIRAEAGDGAVATNQRQDAQADQYVAWFLAIALLFYICFVWMWNPDYGGQRDWDLFSLVAIPEALMLVFALSRLLNSWRYLAAASVPLIAVQALHTGAWIYQNTLPWSWP